MHSLTLINRFSLLQTPFCCRIRDYIVRLRKLYVHGKACSLLEVLEMRSLVTLWVDEFFEEDKGLERLSDAFRFDRIG